LYLADSNITSWGCLFAVPQGSSRSVIYRLNYSCNQTGWAPTMAVQLTGMNVIVNGTLWNTTGPGFPFTGMVWNDVDEASLSEVCMLGL
jgi:hypothetical protein